MPENKRVKKKKKLLLQVGTVSILIFIGSLFFVLSAVFVIGRDSYLDAKEEVIDEDLYNLRYYMLRSPNQMKWLLSYVKENPEEVKRDSTEEEETVASSIVFMNKLADLFDNDDIDLDSETPIYKRLIAQARLQGVHVSFEMEHDSINSTVSLLELINEHEAFLYLDDSQKSDLSDFANVIPFEASEHKAVAALLSKKNDDPDKIYYEVVMDSAKDKAYYNGYLPIRFDDGKMVVLYYQYDWSDYYDASVRRFNIFMLFGVAVLLLLNGLLMFFIYRKAIRPLMQVKMGVEEYKDDKNSQNIVEKMNRIRSKNEIGVLADSFSEMVTEIDRYSEENLKLSNKQSRINTELAVAYNIQKSMLPDMRRAFPERKKFNLAASMDPAKEVGGDFYDFFLVDEDHLCIMIADVSGKGVPAALFMMASKIIMETEAQKGKSPARILTQANKAICSNNIEQMFVTVWLGILELSTGRLTAVNAGHEPPAVLGPNGRFELYDDEHFLFVGIMDDIEYGEYELTLSPGSKLFVYTDGIPEATNAEDELFCLDRMIEALNTDPTAAPEEILANVRKAVDAFVQDAEQFDDLSMLCLEYYG